MKVGITVLFLVVLGITNHLSYHYGKSKGTTINESVVVISSEDTYLPIEVEVNDTRAWNNKNPFNVKFRESDPWKGQIGQDDAGHAIFSSWEYGIRAASIVLKNYSQRHNIDTVEKVIKRFARGNIKPYTKYVCQKLDVKPDEKLDMVRRIPELLRAMARWESGQELPEELFIPYDILAIL